MTRLFYKFLLYSLKYAAMGVLLPAPKYSQSNSMESLHLTRKASKPKTPLLSQKGFGSQKLKTMA